MDGEREPVIGVGNLAAKRDFTDVRDVVRAYDLLAHHGEPGVVYNICSGQAYAIQEILDRLLALCDRPVRVEIDQWRKRPSKVPITLGSAERLKACTGWEPELNLEQTLADTLLYWRHVLKARVKE